MRPIQEVGNEVLNSNPAQFYIWAGTEYGIKNKYLEKLKEHYEVFKEVESVDSILSIMRRKQLIPLKPTLYIVRYDEQFVAKVNKDTAEAISTTNIVGTIVCLYEEEKHLTKFDKHLSDYTTSFNRVASNFIQKYLENDFPELDKRLVAYAVNCRDNYIGAQFLCSGWLTMQDTLLRYSEQQIYQLFGKQDAATELQIRQGTASKNFKYLMGVLDTFDGQLDTILYNMLSTFIELEKLQRNRYAESDIKEYVKLWPIANIYYMFMNTYNELIKCRSYSGHDVKNSIIYLFGLLQFGTTPKPEEMEWTL